MAVYERTYHGYDGPLAPEWSRWLVIPRYGLAQLFASKLFLLLFIAAFFFPVGVGGYIYVVNNLGMLSKLGVQVTGESIAVGGKLFQVFLIVQGCFFSLFITLVAGPTLIATDLRHNGLPLYLARPLSRFEYVAGKASVLVLLLSAITWVPGLLLVGLQVAFGGLDWLGANLRIPLGLLAGSFAVIAVYTMVALAASALMKWRPAATALTFGVIVFSAPVGQVLNEILRTDLGDYLDINMMLQVVWGAVFGSTLVPQLSTLSPALGIVMLTAVCLASVLVIHRRLVAYEVVR